jgi:hypothetical protein
MACPVPPKPPRATPLPEKLPPLALLERPAAGAVLVALPPEPKIGPHQLEDVRPLVLLEPDDQEL